MEDDRFVLTPQEKEYVSKHTVTESDPGLLIRWDWPVVEAFAAASNGLGLPPRPPYIQQMPITASSLVREITTYAAALGGGHLDHYLLAPNSATQFARVLGRLLRQVEESAFIQAVAAVAGGGPLASLAIIADNRVVGAEPAALVRGDVAFPIFA